MIKSGLKKVGYATVISVTETEVNYGDVVYFESSKAGGRAVDASAKGESTPLSADSATQDNIYTNDGYDITVELLGLVDDVEKDWLGKSTDGKGNSVEYANKTELPKFALIVADMTHKGDKKYNVDVYPYCQATKYPDRASKTREKGKPEITYPKYTISAMPRPTDFVTSYTLATDELPQEIKLPTNSETSTTSETEPTSEE